jgi:3-hydroxybutyryl-CoA dehydrogenase
MSATGTVAVVGAGTMGTQLAALFQAKGWKVALLTHRPAKEAAQEVERLRARRWGQEAGVPGELLVVDDPGELRGAGLLVETIAEDLPRKQALFALLDEVVPPPALLTSNTSVLGSRVFARVREQHLWRTALLHFFHPVHTTRLVEVGVHADTAPEVEARLCEVCQALGKTPISLPDIPGGVVSRIVLAMINEAARLLEQGLPPALVDEAMQLGALHPVGPLALADLVGLDVVLANLRYLAEDDPAGRFCPAPALTRLVAEGRLGRKAGAGFFTYR